MENKHHVIIAATEHDAELHEVVNDAEKSAEKLRLFYEQELENGEAHEKIYQETRGRALKLMGELEQLIAGGQKQYETELKLLEKKLEILDEDHCIFLEAKKLCEDHLNEIVLKKVVLSDEIDKIQRKSDKFKKELLENPDEEGMSEN